MTLTSFFAMFFMGNTSLYNQLVVRDMVSSNSLGSLLSTLLYILGFTLVIEGKVEAVRQSIEAASTNAIKKPVSVGILPNPHPEIVKMVELSASRFKGKPEPSSDPKMLGQDPPDFVPEDK